MKKVIRICRADLLRGEYILDINNYGVKTTFNEDIALDVSSWKLTQLGSIVEKLKSVGYKRVEIVTVRGEYNGD